MSGYEFSESEKQLIEYSKVLGCDDCNRLYDCDTFNTEESIVNCMKDKLKNDLKENQRKRKLIYQYNKQYLDIMGNYQSILNNIECRINYIDYLNMQENKKEIERLVNIGSEIVKKLYECNHFEYSY